MKKLIIILCISVGLCLEQAHATINLPFSTTYNCAEQAWAVGNWVNCDGIADGSDDVTDPNASGEQITTAANYSGGGGVRGQRHWIGHSGVGSPKLNQPNMSGGVRFSFSSAVQDVYIRYYVRWESGLLLGGDSGSPSFARNHKMIYFTGSGCGQAGGCYADLEGDTLRIVVNGTPFTNGGAYGWDQMFGGAGGSDQASDGRWICMEIRFKNETSPGAANGIFQWWVDSTLRADITNVNFSSSTGFDAFNFPDNHQFRTPNGTKADAYEDFDDVAIQTTGPIGCLSSGTGGSSTAGKVTLSGKATAN